MKQKDIKIINETRECLKVYWASDIIDVHKREILPYYLFQEHPEVSSTTYEWPVQSAPSQESRRLWIRVIDQIKPKLLITTDGKPFRWLRSTLRERKWELPHDRFPTHIGLIAP